jgi:hypothetical protein
MPRAEGLRTNWRRGRGERDAFWPTAIAGPRVRSRSDELWGVPAGAHLSPLPHLRLRLNLPVACKKAAPCELFIKKRLPFQQPDRRNGRPRWSLRLGGEIEASIYCDRDRKEPLPAGAHFNGGNYLNLLPPSSAAGTRTIMSEPLFRFLLNRPPAQSTLKRPAVGLAQDSSFQGALKQAAKAANPYALVPFCFCPRVSLFVWYISFLQNINKKE